VAAKRKRSQKIDPDKNLKARLIGLFLFSYHEKYNCVRPDDYLFDCVL
jgi:hypothetical protein